MLIYAVEEYTLDYSGMLSMRIRSRVSQGKKTLNQKEMVIRDLRSNIHLSATNFPSLALNILRETDIT